MREDTKHRFAYLAPLDGIRAIAILGVLLYHAAPGLLRGGFTGVDVFFVLSGFLITAIIQSDLHANRFSIGEFLLRRVQRLLPNVIVVVVFVLLLWALLMPRGSVLQPAQHSLWALLNVSNIYVWRTLGGYWDAAAEWAPLTHTWSLGVEEQFYLIYPIGLLILFRYGRRAVLVVLSGFAGLSFLLNVYGTAAHATATFYLLPTRMWELLLGAGIAVHRFRPGAKPPSGLGHDSRAANSIGWGGLALIGSGFFGIEQSAGFPGLSALLPTVGCAMVLLSVTAAESRFARMLARPELVEIGKRSYSLYLWHWPLIIFGKMQADFFGISPWLGAIAGGAVGITLGWIVYDWVELPMRDRGPGRSTRLGIIAGALVLAGAMGMAFTFWRPDVDPNGRFDRLVFSGKCYDAGRPGATDLSGTVQYLDVSFPQRLGPADDDWRRGGVIKNHGCEQPQVAVLGSSHALMYSRLVDELCRDRGKTVAFLGQDGGTPAFFEAMPNLNLPSVADAAQFDEARRNWLKQWNPEVLFVVDRWDLRFTSEADFERRLRAFLAEVSPWTERVVFVTQVPVIQVGENINLRGLIDWKTRFSGELPRLKHDSRESARRRVDAIAEKLCAEYPRLVVLRVDRLFQLDDAAVKYSAGRSFYYADDNHLTDAGAELTRPLFEAALRE